LLPTNKSESKPPHFGSQSYGRNDATVVPAGLLKDRDLSTRRGHPTPQTLADEKHNRCELCRLAAMHFGNVKAARNQQVAAIRRSLLPLMPAKRLWNGTSTIEVHVLETKLEAGYSLKSYCLANSPRDCSVHELLLVNSALHCRSRRRAGTLARATRRR